MLKNYLRIALRNILHQKGHSFINIFGLAIGMAICITIFLWAQFEIGYDQFHENKDRLYRVYSELRNPEGKTSLISNSLYPLAKLLKIQCPPISQVTRYSDAKDILIKYGDKSFTDNNFGFADSSFLEMFSFPLVKGDSKTALTSKFSAVITENLARKYFGSENPLGKTLNINDMMDVQVTGVMKQPPSHSSMKFDILLPFIISKGPDWDGGESVWGFNPLETYVLLTENAQPEEVGAIIDEIVINALPQKTGAKINFHLQPITRIHLYSLDGGGLITYIIIFSLVGLIVLLIACFNFINLTTARAARRAKEVGLRKVIGATRGDLIRQFVGETMLYIIIAFLISVGLAQVFLPMFKELIGASPYLQFSLSPEILIGLACIALVTGMLSGGYPAFFLSAFQPSKVLKGTLRTGSGSPNFRKLIVIFQFTLSIALIIGVVVIYQQLNFIRTKDVGFDKENIVAFPTQGSINEKYETIKSELLRNPNIVNVSRSLQNPGGMSSSVRSQGIDWEGKNPQTDAVMNFEFVDYDYFETFKMKMIEGRSFSKEYSTDSTGFIINEEAANLMGLKDPIGKKIRVMNFNGTIIGIVKNFHFMPFQVKINPLVVGLNPSWVENMYIRTKSENYEATKTYMEGIFKQFNPEYSFNYQTVSEQLDRHYGDEQRLGKGILTFTILAVIIAGLGLLGLATYMTGQRTKEIGIRKVLGASVPGIFLLLSKEFTKWVLLANGIAWPAAYYFMNKWLESFAYRINLNIWIFVLSGGFALLIALMTVSFQSIKTARANPINSLRYE